MKTKTTHTRNDTTVLAKLDRALELSQAEGKLGFTIGLGQAPRRSARKARDLRGLKREIEQAKVRLGLPQAIAPCAPWPLRLPRWGYAISRMAA